MNMKLTNIELSENESKHNIPNIIHFMPGCDDHEKSWRELNPDFVIMSWDFESLNKMIKQSILKNVKIDFDKDHFILACVLCYNYGGVVISKPEQCFVRIQNLIGHISSTLFAVFSLPESTLIDDSIIMSSAKISAFSQLLEYFVQAKGQNKPTAVVFRDFVKASMEASNEGAIVCLHSNVKNALTKAHKKCDDNTFKSLESILPSSNLYRTINPSNLSDKIVPWLVGAGKSEAKADSESIGILVIDKGAFNFEAPVPHAIEAVLAFQEVKLCDDAIVIVAHSPEGGISMDMMMIPQFTMMKAKEVYRTDHVAWKLGTL